MKNLNRSLLVSFVMVAAACLGWSGSVLAKSSSNAVVIQVGQPCGEGLVCQEGSQCCRPGANGCCCQITSSQPACTCGCM
jgi:hypothetical protein